MGLCRRDTIFEILPPRERLTIDSVAACPFNSATIVMCTWRTDRMNGNTSNRGATSGRRTPVPRSARLFGFWSRLLRGFVPLSAFASDARVGRRPSSGKETGPAGVALFGSWGLPRYERLGDRAVGYRGGLTRYSRL